MMYLLETPVLVISFFGTFYYILTSNSVEGRVSRLIPLLFLSLVIDAILSIILFSYSVDTRGMAIYAFLFLILTLFLLFFFLYSFMKIRRLPDSFVWANLFLIFALIATFILYLLYPTWEFQQKGNLLINGYLLALFLLTSCSGLLLFRKSEIKQTDTLTFRLIKIFSVLFGIAWFFLVVWFVARVPGKDLFSSTLYLFSKLVMIAVSLILYFYLFALYKRKLQREKLSRSRGFVTIDELSLPAGTITRLKGEKANETRGVTDTRYRKSLLKTKKLEAYKKIVEEFFLENSHVYLDADFNMNVLSSRTGIPRYHLSQVFSLAFQVSFSEYVNRKRIAHACELMKEGNPTLTISELTEKCGFRSRASFYHHFKKVVGCIPGEYVEPS